MNRIYDAMGKDITYVIQAKDAQLLHVLNENIELKQQIVELHQRLETLRQKEPETEIESNIEEEPVCQPRKKTRRTGAATPSAPAASETSLPSAKTTNSAPNAPTSAQARRRRTPSTAPADPKLSAP